MTIPEILDTTAHRQWEMPSGKWKFYQEWNRAIFLHYKVDLFELEKFVPDELEIDLFDGSPWVSVVAFTMERIRPRNLPSFPLISNFDEINIRTYVKSNGKTGVYFLSIEGGKSLSCKVAKGISELPYRYSKIKRTEKVYQSVNSKLKDKLDVEFTLRNKSNEKTDLDKWLTERYALFQDTDNAINQFEIHHVEWPVQDINIHKLELNYPRFENLLNREPDRIQYSKGVQVLAWDKIKRLKT